MNKNTPSYSNVDWKVTEIQLLKLRGAFRFIILDNIIAWCIIIY